MAEIAVTKYRDPSAKFLTKQSGTIVVLQKQIIL